jgi:hypothetical protein
MAGTTPLTIGADVSCTDGACGKVSRLVIDPRTGTVTHLVVNDRQLRGRLVPLSLVDVDAGTGQIRLRCPIAEFGKLHPAEVTVSLLDNDADPEASNDQFLYSVGSMPPTATSARSRGSSSTPAATRSPTCSSRRDTCSAARTWLSRSALSRQSARTVSSSTSPSGR